MVSAPQLHAKGPKHVSISTIIAIGQAAFAAASALYALYRVITG